MHFQLGSGLSRKIDRYDSETFEADAQVGRILDALREAGQMDETIVVFTTDHGDSMGEHEKIIVDWLTPSVERYDLRLDPQELNDLVALERARLLGWKMGQWSAPPEANTDGVSQEIIDELQAVGYLDHSAQPGPTPGSR